MVCATSSVLLSKMAVVKSRASENIGERDVRNMVSPISLQMEDSRALMMATSTGSI